MMRYQNASKRPYKTILVQFKMLIKNLKNYVLLKWFAFVDKGLLTDIILMMPSLFLMIILVIKSDINLLNKPHYLNASTVNESSLFITGAFIRHPSLWLISSKTHNYPQRKNIKNRITWYIDGRKLKGQDSSIITIPLNTWLGLRNETIKGCLDDADYRLNRCATYKINTKDMKSSSFPPEATLFTYMYSEKEIRAGYYYHSRTMSKEGDSLFYWVAKDRYGDMKLLKKCQPRMECKLTFDQRLRDIDVGALIQPIDINGTLGRGDVSWFHYDKRGRLLGKDA